MRTQYFYCGGWQNMEKGLYKKLFLSTFQLSACTFGGGFVIIPLMRRKFVRELNWISEQEMMDITAIAQSSPGAIAVNASVMTGYQIAGFPGAMIAVLGTVLPPLLIISVISFFYRQFRDSLIVSLVMRGMLAGVAAVVCDVVINMLRSICSQKRIFPILMFVLAFAAVRFFGVNIILIILVCGLFGALDRKIQDKEAKA